MLDKFPHLKKDPIISDSCFVDPSARINGDVNLGEFCSVWFHTSLRGDVNRITVGDYSNIQDGCIVHTTYQKFSTTIGHHVTFGHGVIAHGCTIGSNVLLGMQSLILDGAEIGDNVILGAGSLVTEGKKIPAGVLAFGRPAKVIRPLTQEEKLNLVHHAEHYSRMAQSYKERDQWFGWQDNPYHPDRLATRHSGKPFHG